MSVLTTARAAAAVTDPSQEAERPDYVQQLIQLMPSEAVAVFTGGMALMVANNWGWTVRWIFLAAICVLVVGWSFLNYWDALAPETKKSPTVRVPVFTIAVSTLAFIAWSATIPETPFLQWHVWDLSWAPFISLGAAVVLTAATRWYKSFWMVRHPAANQPQIKIVVPTDGATYDHTRPVTPVVERAGPIDHVDTEGMVDGTVDMAVGQHAFVVTAKDVADHEVAEDHVEYTVV